MHARLSIELHPSDAKKYCINSAFGPLHMEHHVGKLLVVK